MRKTSITLAALTAAALLGALPGARAQVLAGPAPVMRAAVPVITCPHDRPDPSAPYAYTIPTGGYSRMGRDPFAMALCGLPDSLIAKAPAAPALMLSYRDYSAAGGMLEARLYRKSMVTNANELIAVLTSAPSAAIRIGRVPIGAAFLPLDTKQWVYWVSVAIRGDSTIQDTQAHLVGLGE